jgi:hypothetical protein
VLKKNTPQRPPPFSIRLNHNERERLEAEAAGMPLGTYIKAKVLNGAPLKRAAAVEDRKALSQALALLGQSRIASNLNQLAHLGNIGALPLTPEMQAELLAALQHVAEVRALLIKAVGLKDGGPR